MDHKATLEELNKASLLKLEEYMKAKAALKEEDHQKVHKAKEDWQYAWNQLMESLLVLERLEI
jgi:hypothetical protein